MSVKDVGKQMLSNAQKSFLKEVGNLAKPNKQNVVNAMDNAVQPAAESLAKKKKGFWGNLLEKGTNLVKAVAPAALSAIPVAGPILANLASAINTNDDEWFDEFKSAGATFNELLADTKLSSEGNMRLITPGMLVTQVELLQDSMSAVSTFESQYLPIILAYVRKKTNNVLVTTESDYWKAFVTGSRLYAIYYTLEKYVKLTEDLPTNIPALTGTLPLINPINYSALVGVVDSLKNYLQITIKLPFAWTQYLRWRFGTMFLSENTGKSGLISYDYKYLVASGASVYDLSVVPAQISANIDALKAILASTSRAVADIKLAYDDHQLKYDVETRHYDAKEFNLRCNLNSERTRGIPSLNWNPLGVLIYMDSRLDQNAAVQAITLSTAGSDNNAPFHISGMYIAWYVADAYDITYYHTPAAEWKQARVGAGWYTNAVSYDIVDKIGNITVTQGQGAFAAEYLEKQGYVTPVVTVGQTADGAALNAYQKLVASYCISALQVHNQDFETIMGEAAAGAKRFAFKSKLLSYDAAIITGTQIESIHRIALRNLFRGTYKAKTPASKDPNVVEPIADIIDTSVGAVEAQLPNNM